MMRCESLGLGEHIFYIVAPQSMRGDFDHGGGSPSRRLKGPALGTQPQAPPF
jgi:hypothetical protein